MARARPNSAQALRELPHIEVLEVVIEVRIIQGKLYLEFFCELCLFSEGPAILQPDCQWVICISLNEVTHVTSTLQLQPSFMTKALNDLNLFIMW